MDFINQVAHFFADNPGMLLHETWGTIVLSVASIGAAIAIAMPIGVLVGHLHRWSFLAINGGNALRSLPTLAIIAVGIGLYGLGFVNIWIALVILALPLVLTNTYVAVDSVSPELVEAARGVGMSPWQIVVRVELPSAVPLIMSGIRTGTVYVIATAYLAGWAGHPGTFGDVITNQGSYTLAGVVAVTIISVVLAFIAEGLLGLLENALTPRGLKFTRLERPAAEVSV